MISFAPLNFGSTNLGDSQNDVEIRDDPPFGMPVMRMITCFSLGDVCLLSFPTGILGEGISQMLQITLQRCSQNRAWKINNIFHLETHTCFLVETRLTIDPIFFPQTVYCGVYSLKKRGVHRLARACSVGRGLGVAWRGRGLGVAWAWRGRGLGVAWARLGRGVGVAWAWRGRGLGVARAWLGHGLGVAWAWLGRGLGAAWAWARRGRGRGVGAAWARLGRGVGVACAWLGRGVGAAWAWRGRGLGVAWGWRGCGRGVGKNLLSNWKNIISKCKSLLSHLRPLKCKNILSK